MLWDRIARPLLFRRDPETVHEWSMGWFVRTASLPGAKATLSARYRVNDPRLAVDLFGLRFPSPIGLAAGFDKNAKWVRPLASLGFGFLEVGTLTPRPQEGNPKPRLFRLPKDSALINRLGFNNAGASAAAERLSALQGWRESSAETPVIGINIGKNKTTPNENAADDYDAALTTLWPFADYVTVNVSSPNTVGLRELQDPDALETLLGVVTGRNAELAVEHDSPAKPVLLKIAPDLASEALPGIVEVAQRHKLAGLIATNTTIRRDVLTHTPAATVEEIGAGGLSGAPLHETSLSVVSELARLSAGALPIIGVGGVTDTESAWKMITAGAAIVQSYTGFVYGGPGFARDINRGLLRKLDEHGLTHISEAVGMSQATAPAS